MQFTHEHLEIQKTLQALHRRGDQSARRRMGGRGDLPGARGVQAAGRAGPARADQAGGLRRRRLDYSYAMAMAEALGHIDCGGVPMAIGVQTDMCNAGAGALRQRRTAPRVPRAGHRRRHGRLHRRERARRRQRRRRHQEPRAQGRRRLPHHRPEDVDHQQPAGRLDVHAGQHRRRPGAQEQVAGDGADARWNGKLTRASRWRRRSARSACIRATPG